jgi:hypothetical protein
MLAGWIKKLFGRSESKIVDPASSNNREPTDEELIDDYKACISRYVAAGYMSPEEALQTASEVMGDDISPDILKSKGPEILEEVLAAHIADQAGWPEITDCDRLDSAFAALEAKGIVSRQDFSCCGTCGSSEIWDEMDDARNAGNLVRRYTFFHMQDTESATEGIGLYLNYGSIEEGGEASVAIGCEIQGELEKHGLETDWDGTISKRIGVSLDWKRRLKLPPQSQLN